MEHKQTVLMVHNYYQIPGGEDTVVENEKELLEEHGHKVILYTRHNNELKSYSKIKKFLLPFTTVFNIKTYKDIKRIIKKECIDIVHVHNTLTLISPSVYYAALACKVPVVQTVHNFRLLCPGATFYRDGHICEDCLQKGLQCAVKHGCYRKSRIQTLACVITTKIHRILKIYSRINYICLTEFNKEKILSLEKVIKKSNVYVKPNFVKKCDDINIEDKKDCEKYIFAGRIDELKGIKIILEAWMKMGDTAPELYICGTGPLENLCKEIIDRYDLNIKMLGFKNNKDTIKYISQSKALILPTQWYEGFPMSIVESLSVGTPVICSDIGNASSIVEEGITGYKFKYNESEDLIRAMNICQKNPTTVYNEYKRRYSDEVNYKLLKNIYLEILR